MYDVWIYYPMPFREDIDKKLQAYDGWYGSGVNLIDNIRDNSVRVPITDMVSLTQIIPTDGNMTVRLSRK